MRQRKLLTSLVAAGLLTVAFGAAILPAAASQRVLVVTLLDGHQVTINVEADAATPLDQVALPDFGQPVIAVSEGQPAAPPSQSQLTQAPTAAEQAAAQAPQPDAAPVVTGETRQRASARVRRDSSRGRRESLKRDSSARDPSVTAVAPAPVRKRELRAPDGQPTLANPTVSLAAPGPAPLGQPNFFIDKFRIPPFLLPIYQAAGIQYGIRWEVLAAINEIETDYGRNPNVSSAGAVGWMQFMPATWKSYGVDANRDGTKDPRNPVDAIFAAARYLKAAGGDVDLRKAIFAYNHADWYVDSVLMRAQLIGGLPADVLSSLTGLTQAHFPVAARARYADDVAESARHARERSVKIFAKAGSPVIAANDGVVKRFGKSRSLGRYLVLEDASGNSFMYAHLGSIAKQYAAPRRRAASSARIARELKLPKADPKPVAPATAGTQRRRAQASPDSAPAPSADAQAGKMRLFANPSRPAARAHGGAEQLTSIVHPIATTTRMSRYFAPGLGLKKGDFTLRRLRRGARVIAGTVLARIDKTSPRLAPHLLYMIRPAGRGAPLIDPKVILDSSKLLESTQLYRVAGKNPFFGPDADSASVGEILLMSKEDLQRRVLSDPRVDLYSCGRADVRSGAIDRRVLAMLEFLAANGLRPTVSSLQCGHGFFTASGNVSEHSYGAAVDIAKVNGIPIYDHQGAGSITDITIRRLLTLQGAMKPHQIISLMKPLPGTDNMVDLADHYDHIHVGFRPLGGSAELGPVAGSSLKPRQWRHLFDRIGNIENPKVATKPSKWATRGTRSGSRRSAD